MTLLGIDVIRTHTLPCQASGMAMHEGYASASLRSLRKDARKIVRFEASVAMHVPLAVSRQDQAFDHSGCAGLTRARMPEREAEVFLTVGAQKVTTRQRIDRLRHG